MRSILVAVADPVYGAVIQDRLRAAGHRVELLAARERTMATAAARDLDLIILDLERSLPAGLEVVTALKATVETRSVPLLVLAAAAESADRVAVLRAGADDYLAKPCDLEEVVLRAERAAALAAAAVATLNGELSDYPVWELVQFLLQTKKSGPLRLEGRIGAGRVQLDRGRVTAVSWEQLRGPEALLAVFGLKQGTFKFAAVASPAADASGLTMTEVQEILMRAAWVEDELQRRAEAVPPTGAPLAVIGPVRTEVDEELAAADLPLAQVAAAIAAGAGMRVFDLVSDVTRAPQVIRLAVAVLVEHGTVAVTEAGLAGFMNTAELASAQLVESAVGEFLVAARAAGFGTSALPYTIVVGDGPWPRLLALLQSVPGYYRNPTLTGFVAQLSEHGGGTLQLSSEHGKLFLHVARLTAAAKGRIEASVTMSAGVLVWLDTIDDLDAVRAVVDRLEAVKDTAAGILVVDQREQEWAANLLDGTRRWRLLFHEPQTLLGLFGLLRPSG